VVIAYADPNTAFQVRDRLVSLQKEEIVALDDLVVVVRELDGKVKLHQYQDLIGPGALSGAFWGLLIGLFFMAPWLGLAVGAVTGAIAGKYADIGIDDKFIKRVTETIKPGNSAVFMLLRKVTPDKCISAIKEYGGTVIQTSLTDEQEAELRSALGGQ
jgi:uncharacterized membrane protein